MMMLTSMSAAVVMCVSLLGMAAAQSPQPCRLPTGERYSFSLVHFSAQSGLFPDSAFVDGYRLHDGIDVPDDVWLRASCSRDANGNGRLGPMTSLCRDGVWSDDLPDCSDYASCGMIPYVFGAYSVEPRRPGVTYAHGTMVTFFCRRRGQRPSGSNEITCNNGTWSPVTFRCL